MSQPPRPAGVGSIAMSRLLAVACLALAIALPLLTGHALYELSAEGWLNRFGIRTPMPVSPWQVGMALALGLLPACAMAYGLFRVQQCLRGFVRGETFCLSTVRHLRQFAAAALSSAVLGLVVPVPISLILTWHAPAGQRALSVSIGSSELLMALVAGIVWQVAAVFTRAIELADENAQFV